MVTAKHLYHRVTNQIRITVRPSFLAGQSHPTSGRYVFAYAVRIENVGTDLARLTHRRWNIHDAVDGGEDQEVQGEGVVGEQPILQPGAVYEYQSYCILKGPAGYMEGAYRFERGDGTAFAAEIPRFDLKVTADSGD
jgi:ApaG protein